MKNKKAQKDIEILYDQIRLIKLQLRALEKYLGVSFENISKNCFYPIYQYVPKELNLQEKIEYRFKHLENFLNIEYKEVEEPTTIKVLKYIKKS